MNIPTNTFTENMSKDEIIDMILNHTDFLNDIFRNIHFDEKYNQKFNDIEKLKMQFIAIQPMKYVISIDLKEAFNLISNDKIKQYIYLKVRNPFVRIKACEYLDDLRIPLINAICSPIDYVCCKVGFPTRCYDKLFIITDNDEIDKIIEIIKYAFSTIGIDFKPNLTTIKYEDFEL